MKAAQKNVKAKKATKKATKKSPKKSPKKSAPVLVAAPNAFMRGVTGGGNTVGHALGFVAGATNGLVVQPILLVVGSVVDAVGDSFKVAGALLGSSRRSPAKVVQRRKS
jgi:hypothetical protein